MHGGYVARRVASGDGVTVGIYGPEDGAELHETFRRFLARAPAPPQAEILECDDVILGGGQWACLYDRDGRRIDASALVRYDEAGAPQLWRAPPALPHTRTVLTIHEPVVYGSVFFNHWGHFLLESTARLWAVQGELGRLPVIHAWRADAEPAVADFLNGVGANGLVAPAGFVRLAKCFVPTASFAHDGYAERRHLLAPHAVARRRLSPGAREPRPIYLSRSRVSAPVPGRKKLLNEAELEASLEARGVRVVHMQEHTLAEQIGLMNRHPAVIGLWGSALHNTLFALAGERLSTFTLVDGCLPANFLLVDALVGADAHYLDTLRETGDGGLRIDVAATLNYLRDCGAV